MALSWAALRLHVQAHCMRSCTVQISSDAYMLQPVPMQMTYEAHFCTSPDVNLVHYLTGMFRDHLLRHRNRPENRNAGSALRERSQARSIRGHQSSGEIRFRRRISGVLGRVVPARAKPCGAS